MAPESCGHKVLVVSSPYKIHTHSRASIQLGQHHLKPYAPFTLEVVSESRIWVCSFVLQPWSFGSHCAGWVTRSARRSIIPPHTTVVRLPKPLFGWTACANCGRSVPIVSRRSADNYNWKEHYGSVGRGAIRHVATSQTKEESTTKGQRAKFFSCLVNKCVVMRT